MQFDTFWISRNLKVQMHYLHCCIFPILYCVTEILDTFQMCTRYLPLSVTHRQPLFWFNLQHSQWEGQNSLSGPITVLDYCSLSEQSWSQNCLSVKVKTNSLWLHQQPALPGDSWLPAGWWSFRLLMRLTPGLRDCKQIRLFVCHLPQLTVAIFEHFNSILSSVVWHEERRADILLVNDFIIQNVSMVQTPCIFYLQCTMYVVLILASSFDHSGPLSSMQANPYSFYFLN